MSQFSYNNDDLQLSGLLTPSEDGDTSMTLGEFMETSPVPTRLGLSRTTSMFEGSNPDHVFAVPKKTIRPALTSRRAFSKHDRSVSKSPARQDDKENDLAEQWQDSPKKTPRKFFGLGFTRKEVPADEMQRSPLGPITANKVASRAMPQFRRAESMISSHSDFLQPVNQPNTSMGSPREAENQPTILPSFESRNDQIRRISGATLARVLDGHYSHSYDELQIVDCRFAYEYEGGHVLNAINISSLQALDDHPLLTDPKPHRTLIILHCEFSAVRAPRIALHLRRRDRELNKNSYPRLHYPEMYILEGGYSTFHNEYAHHATTYVGMKHEDHKACASKQMHVFRKTGKFQRTQSYTFGQDSPTMLTGGLRMERESNFRLAAGPGVGARQDPLIAAAAIAVGSRLLTPERSASAAPIMGSSFLQPAFQALSTEMVASEESEGDTSMMDVDDAVSPVPVYQNTANNTLQRGHARTQSGRIEARRLTSF
jgi:M-phase inducer tyrosine phosphatase